MKILDMPLAFIDVETTGGSSANDRVLEIGVVRVERNLEVARFSTLLNPIGYVPPIIERITGITSEEVQWAPVFSDVVTELDNLLRGAIFTAHNVNFDYGFLGREFSRTGYALPSMKLCTVRLSRLLYPKYARHNLDALIQRHGLEVSARHRALPDAVALWQFYQLCLYEFDLGTLETAFLQQIKL